MAGIAALCCAMPVFAESAPVYEADSLPPEQEVNADQAQYYPPPPAPGQEANTFVPMQSQQAAAPQAMPAPAAAAEPPVNPLQTTDNAKVDSLQEQVQALRNQVELLSRQMEQLQNQQKTQYSDLDKRLNQNKANNLAAVNEETPVPLSTGKKGKHAKQANIISADNLTGLNEKSISSQPNVAEEQQIYQTAYNLIKSKKYDEAVNALQSMLKRYPSGQFASNAHYWLGELYGLMGKNDQALKEFTSVIQAYPDSPRVSDAQLKVGLILASEFKWGDAKLALKKVVNHYPGSASARLAAEQLKQIRQAGH